MANGDFVFGLALQRLNRVETMKSRAMTAPYVLFLGGISGYFGQNVCLDLSTPFKK
jgi:hypothetical protein